MNIGINTFGGGELTPKLDARYDIEKHASGCRHLENFLPEPYGDVQRRPGTEYLYGIVPIQSGIIIGRDSVSLGGALLTKILFSGAIDTSWATSGNFPAFCTAGAEGGTTTVICSCLLRDGSILFSHTPHNFGGGLMIMTKLNPAGVIDTTFGTNGHLTTTLYNLPIYALVEDSSGNIYAGGDSTSSSGINVLYKYSANGTLIWSWPFTTNGAYLTSVLSLALSNDETRLFAGGAISYSVAHSGIWFSLECCLTSTGAVDTTWGTYGLWSCPSVTPSYVNALLVDSNNKLWIRDSGKTFTTVKYMTVMDSAGTILFNIQDGEPLSGGLGRQNQSWGFNGSGNICSVSDRTDAGAVDTSKVFLRVYDNATGTQIGATIIEAWGAGNCLCYRPDKGIVGYQYNFFGGQSIAAFGAKTVACFDPVMNLVPNYPTGSLTSVPVTTINPMSLIQTSQLNTIREIGFTYSSTVSYVVVLGNKTMKFFYDGVVLTTDGLTPHSDHSTDYSISTPYLVADLFDLQFEQLGDVMRITHPSYATAKLARTDVATFTLTDIPFKNGPFLLRNDLIDVDVVETSALMSCDVLDVGKTGTLSCQANFLLQVGMAPMPGGAFVVGSTITDSSTLETAVILSVTDATHYVITEPTGAGFAVGDNIWDSYYNQANGDGTYPTVADYNIPYFEAGHVGALFQLTHPAGTLNVNGTAYAASFIGSAVGEEMLGDYTFRITHKEGTGALDVRIEKSDNGFAGHITSALDTYTSDYVLVKALTAKGRYVGKELLDGWFYRIRVKTMAATSVTASLVANTNSVTAKFGMTSGPDSNGVGVMKYPLDIKGPWRYQTDGNWDGTFVIERNENGAGWEPYRTVVSTLIPGTGIGSHNQQEADVEDADNVQYRMNMVVHNAGTITATLTSEANTKSGIVQVTSLTSDTPPKANIIVLVELGLTDPTRRWAEGAWSIKRGYPSCVTFHEGRCVYGGQMAIQAQVTSSYDEATQLLDPKQPTLWLSHSDDFDNFDAGVKDGDSYSLTIKSTEEIMWVAGLEKLFVGTGADEWLISANKLDAILTPTNTTARKHSSYGSSRIQPLNMLDSLLFVDKTGQHVREITYEDKNGKDDLSLLAEHITKAGIKSWCVQEGIETIVWCFLEDYTVVTLTYDPTEKIKAWAKQPIDGDVLTGCVVPGAEEDELYLGIQRTINSQAPIYIETMASWDITTLADCFYVDCGKTFTAVNATVTVTGATHLIGETVAILADGLVQTSKVVDGSGHITLDTAANKVQYGLAYTSLLQPFRLVINNPRGGTSYMSDTKISNLKISLYLAGYIEQSSDNVTYWPIDLTNINWTNTSDIAGLLTGDVEATSDSGFDPLNPIYIRSSKPLPLTVRAIVAKLDVTG